MKQIKNIFKINSKVKIKTPNKLDKVFILICLVILTTHLNLIAYNYPSATVNVNNNPYQGYMLLGSNNINAGFFDNYGMAPDSLVKKWTNLKGGSDFKLHKNGLFTFFDHSKEKFMVLNSELNLVDSIKCVGSYITDFHDIQYHTNGNILIYGVDERTMDLSQIVVNGKTNAKVKGFIIQELNPQKQLVWEWSTFDHFSVIDAVSAIDLTGAAVSPWHINSLIYDTDGNILISSRFMDEVTKINRQNGEIIWRLGGQSCKNNQFTFISDTDEKGYVGFSHQHTPLRLKNGNLMIFDNGNIKSTSQYSRVVEYEINETNKTAKKVWEYRLSPDYFTAQMGSVQELDNGNIFVSWGKRQTEVNKAKVLLFDMEFQSDLSYRGYKFNYDMDALGLLVNSKKSYNFNTSNQKTYVDLNVDTLGGAGLITVQRHKYFPPFANFTSPTPILLPLRYVINKSDSISNFKAIFKVDTRTIPNFQLSDSVKVYYRPKEGGGSFTILPTTYGTNILEARIPGNCEIVLGYRLPLGTPILTYPINNSVGLPFKNTNIKWNKIETASNYQMQIATDITFSNIILDTLLGNVDKLIYNFNSYTKYYIRTKSKNNLEESNWSQVYNFETLISTPELISPIDKSFFIGLKDTLKWQTIDGAKLYQLQISKNENFNSTEIILDENISGIEKIVNLEYNTKYYWRTKAKRDTTSSEFSDIFEFTTKIAPIKLIFPINNEKFFALDNEFSWEKSTDNNFYQIDISEDINFTKIIYTDIKLTEPKTKAKNLKNNFNYFWRLRTFDDKNKSDWSETFKFLTQINTPFLLKPNNNLINVELDTKLIWERVNGANKYRVQLSKENDFTNLLIDTLINDINKAEISLDINGLEIETNYFWQVKAINDLGETKFSNIFTFTTRSKNFTQSPILSKPNNGSTFTIDSVYFTWSKVTSAKSYKFQISVTNTFSELFSDNTITENYISLNSFQKKIKYYWRVMAISDESNSAWSNIRNFTYIDENSKLPTPILTFPLDNENAVSVLPILSWETNSEYKSHNIIVANDIDFTNEVIEFNNFTKNQLDFKIDYNSKLNFETKYYWKVQGLNAEKFSDWSEIWSFTTEKDTITSIEDFGLENSNVLVLYPNPTYDYIKLSSNDYNLGLINDINIEDIQILNSIGENFECNINKSANEILINCNNLSPNLYFIKIEIKNKYFIYKILKLNK